MRSLLWARRVIGPGIFCIQELHLFHIQLVLRLPRILRRLMRHVHDPANFIPRLRGADKIVHQPTVSCIVLMAPDVLCVGEHFFCLQQDGLAYLNGDVLASTIGQRLFHAGPVHIDVHLRILVVHHHPGRVSHERLYNLPPHGSPTFVGVLSYLYLMDAYFLPPQLLPEGFALRFVFRNERFILLQERFHRFPAHRLLHLPVLPLFILVVQPLLQRRRHALSQQFPHRLRTPRLAIRPACQLLPLRGIDPRMVLHRRAFQRAHGSSVFVLLHHPLHLRHVGVHIFQRKVFVCIAIFRSFRYTVIRDVVASQGIAILQSRGNVSYFCKIVETSSSIS